MRGWIIVRGCYLPPRDCPRTGTVPPKRFLGQTPAGSVPPSETRRRKLSSDDALELGNCAFEVVVDDRIGELAGELALFKRLGGALRNLGLALSASPTQAPLELLAVGGGDEDRDAARHPVADGQCAAGLELQEHRMALLRDPLDLGPQRAGALALSPWPLDPLEELIDREQALELLLAP